VNGDIFNGQITVNDVGGQPEIKFIGKMYTITRPNGDLFWSDNPKEGTGTMISIEDGSMKEGRWTMNGGFVPNTAATIEPLSGPMRVANTKSKPPMKEFKSTANKGKKQMEHISSVSHEKQGNKADSEPSRKKRAVRGRRRTIEEMKEAESSTMSYMMASSTKSYISPLSNNSLYITMSLMALIAMIMSSIFIVWHR